MLPPWKRALFCGDVVFCDSWPDDFGVGRIGMAIDREAGVEDSVG